MSFAVRVLSLKDRKEKKIGVDTVRKRITLGLQEIIGKKKKLTLNSVNSLITFPPEFCISVLGITSIASATARKGHPLTHDVPCFLMQINTDSHLRRRRKGGRKPRVQRTWLPRDSCRSR